ncbi:hypothetical protein OROMI_025552 [Orobanche minor]
MPSQEIQKIGDGPFGGGRNFDIPKKALETAQPSQEILKIRDGTPLEAEGILTYRKSPRNCSVWHFSSKLDVPSNVLQKKRVARILVFKIRQSQEILKIRDGTPLEAEEILTYRKSKLDVLSNVVQKKGVARILVFKIRPSQEILKIRDGTPLEAEGILTYRKSPRNCSGWHFSSKLDVPSNVLQKKRVARILVFKIRPSQEILKIRDGTPLEAKGIFTYRKRPSKLLVAQILVFKIRPSQEILKIRDGTPLEADGILTYRKSPRNCSVWHFSSKLDVPSNVLQKKRVARILVFKIRPSQEILKILDGTPLEAEGILTYRKRPSQEIQKIGDGPFGGGRNFDIPKKALETAQPSQEIQKIGDGPFGGGRNFDIPKKALETAHKLDVLSNVVQKKGVARILVFKIRPSQEILKIRDGTPLEAEGILTYRKSPRNCSGWHFSSKLDVPSNVLQKKRVARILVFKIRPSQEILKIRDGTPLEAKGILHTEKGPRNCSVWHFSSKLDVPSNVVQKKRVAQILVFKIRPSQEILKIRDGTPLEADGILTYRKSPRNCSVWHFSSKLDVPSNIVQKKGVARILVFKIRPSQEILKIRDGTPLEAEGIFTYRKRPSKLLVAQILVFKIRPSQEILKIRDGTPLEADGILTYRKSPRNCSVWHFSSKLDVPSNVLQKKRVARILVFKIRPSQEILKILDGTPLEAEGILTYRKRPSKLLEIQKIGDGPFGGGRNFDIPKKALETAQVARILDFKIRPSQEILKIRDGTPLEAEGILTYRKSPRNCSVWHFSSKLDVPSNVLQKKRVARILVFKIRQSQEILKIRDGTPLEAEEILTYRKRPSKLLGLASQEILKIRDGTPLEAEGILTYRKSPRNCSGWHFSSKLDVPSHLKKF